ncbi:cellulose binding domain-containing protein [Cellulomonas sp. Leaf334]|uniref:cellulose binding domain-containing protein n=1 Tax=Cellulomonas sp. Leaf334 TaxID=1736339 RepID=UPI000A8432E1|nr:cellulose binding domain-containing protein [Cellulomonas sp. Leaf334]
MSVRRLTAVVVAAAVSVAGGFVSAGPAVAAEEPVAVTVDAHAGLGTVPTFGTGANHAIWDTELGSPETSTLLKAAGVTMLRYPGGSYADIYHWEDHTAPGGYVAPNTDFDTFMAGARRTGAQPIVIANYGTGSAEEAAGWVRYANVTKKYGVTYWEIGNENYGNGHYGTSWEADDHEDKSPTQYANEVVAYAAAMKAVDPKIKIGAVLTTPGNWPDNIVGPGDSAPWNETVLSIAGPSIDFVILHWYPGGTDAGDALAKPEQVVDIAEMTRAQITRHAGASSGRIGISLTELNAGFGINTQPGALFAADTLPALWAAGVFTVDWWNVRNGIGTVSTVAGQTDYGDFGLFSSGSCNADGSVCEPPLNTPFAPYHALALLDRFANAGDQLLRVTTNDPAVRGHAVRRPNGELAVMLLNEDPDRARTVAVDYAGYTPSPNAPKVWTYLNGGTGIVESRTGTAASQTLPAYSLTTFTIKPKLSRTLPPTAGTPIVSAVTDSTATVTWKAVPASVRTAGYDVHLQDGDDARLVGHVTGTSTTLTGLEPGSRYTVTVVTTDKAGAQSWSTPAVAFVTGTPAESGCSVRLTNASDWGNGHVGSVDITNTGDVAVDGWTLGFTFPRPWLSFGGGWNGTWTASGDAVTATNVDWNATIAPGATVNVGYVGNYGGPNVLPNLFTLNGTLCTTTT